MEISSSVATVFTSGVTVLILGVTLTWFSVLFSLLTSAMFGRIMNDAG